MIHLNYEQAVWKVVCSTAFFMHNIEIPRLYSVSKLLLNLRFFLNISDKYKYCPVYNLLRTYFALKFLATLSELLWVCLVSIIFEAAQCRPCIKLLQILQILILKGDAKLNWVYVLLILFKLQDSFTVVIELKPTLSMWGFTIWHDLLHSRVSWGTPDLWVMIVSLQDSDSDGVLGF